VDRNLALAGKVHQLVVHIAVEGFGRLGRIAERHWLGDTDCKEEVDSPDDHIDQVELRKAEGRVADCKGIMEPEGHIAD
jgi:hypothetical protein